MLKLKIFEVETSLSNLFLTEEGKDDGNDNEADTKFSTNALLEIRAGTGGIEATLFTSELWMMYQKYAQVKGWKFTQLSISEEESSMGIREACASIIGPGAFRSLKFEGGVHRVQRVPVTDNSGRMHTSTASVVVLNGSESNTGSIVTHLGFY